MSPSDATSAEPKRAAAATLPAASSVSIRSHTSCDVSDPHAWASDRTWRLIERLLHVAGKRRDVRLCARAMQQTAGGPTTVLDPARLAQRIEAFLRLAGVQRGSRQHAQCPISQEAVGLVRVQFARQSSRFRSGLVTAEQRQAAP